MKVIFVDDSEIWRDELHDAGDAHGISVITYALPFEVEAQELQTSDAVIIDNKFGKEGYLGIQFIRSIRAQGYSGRIVLYTNNPRQHECREVANLGGRVVEKSVFPDMLIESLC